MSREVKERSKAISTTNIMTLAVGVAAFGAIAIAALAIGRLVIGHLVIERTRFNALEIDDLTVKRLHVVEPQGSHP
jgi:hypothetical protein